MLALVLPPRLRWLVVIVCLLVNIQALEAETTPSVRVQAQNASGTMAAGISVEASDAEGLDSIEIACVEFDSKYHTQLSRSSIDRHFKRIFTLSELFPSLKEGTAVHLKVSVRNVHGAVSSANAVVSTSPARKEN